MSRLWWFAAIVAASVAVAFQFLDASGPVATPSTTTPQRRVQVVTEKAVTKKSPLSIEYLGSVTTAASVAIRPWIDDEIVGIHFAGGAEVKKGDATPIATIVENEVAVVRRVEAMRSTAGEAVIHSGLSSSESVVTTAISCSRIEHP